MNSLGMAFVEVPGVPVLVCRHETTVKQFAAYQQATGAKHQDAGLSQTGSHPVVNISWNEAKAFCEWLGQKEGRRYRLPTDAEWSVMAGIAKFEPAGVAPNRRPPVKGWYPWGNRALFKGAGNYCDESFVRGGYGDSLLLPFRDGFAATAPVGSFAPDAHGLYDLGGNVWEWCEDWYDPPTHTLKVVRGGAWRTGAEERMLSSFRGPDPPQAQLDSIGFRIVVMP